MRPGALTHDIVFNADQTPRSISAFYSFGYRARHRFSARALLGERDTYAGTSEVRAVIDKRAVGGIEENAMGLLAGPINPSRHRGRVSKILLQ